MHNTTNERGSHSVQVKEVMTRTTQCVRSDESIADAARRIHEIGMTALPVCGQSNDLVGTLSEEDAAAPVGGDLSRVIHVGDVMRPSFYCFEDQDIAEAAGLMKNTGVRRLVVIDRRMHLVGMVWRGDVAPGR